MKKLIAGLGVIALVFQVSASSGRCCPKKGAYGNDSLAKASFHYLSLGGAFIDNDDLNTRLEPNGVGDFSPYSALLGFGSVRWYRRYIAANDFEMLLWKKNSRDNMAGRLNVGRFTSVHGIRLVDGERFSLYPLAGIGAGFTLVKMWPEEVTFDAALNDNSVSETRYTLFQPTFLLDIGIGAHFSKELRNPKKGRGIIGVRAGYIWDPVKNDRWYQGRSVVTDGPDANLSGPYLRLVLGFTHPSKPHGCTTCRHRGGCKMKK